MGQRSVAAERMPGQVPVRFPTRRVTLVIGISERVEQGRRFDCGVTCAPALNRRPPVAAMRRYRVPRRSRRRDLRDAPAPD